MLDTILSREATHALPALLVMYVSATLVLPLQQAYLKMEATSVLKVLTALKAVFSL